MSPDANARRIAFRPSGFPTFRGYADQINPTSSSTGSTDFAEALGDFLGGEKLGGYRGGVWGGEEGGKERDF